MITVRSVAVWYLPARYLEVLASHTSRICTIAIPYGDPRMTRWASLLSKNLHEVVLEGYLDTGAHQST